MAEATAVLESSPEVPVMDVSRGPLVDITSDQRAEFRKTGELPRVEPKKEEAAPSSEAGKAESAGDAETPEQKQERIAHKPKQTAAERIADLKATIAKIEKGAGIKSEAESTPAKPEPKQQAVEQPQFTRPKPAVDGKGPDGKPYETYEAYIEDLTDWKTEQRDAKNQRETAQREQAREFNAKVNEARTRYENFDEVVQPTATAINTDAAIPPVIKTLLSESDMLPDFLFTLGSDPAELAKFVKMAKETPGKAIRYIALTESLIAEELEGKKAKPAHEETPAKPKTAAPKPPAEAGGRAATPPDALESAAKANDFRSFKAESTRRQLAKLKG